ncbi:DoxX family protein [Archangium gephyra]|uniref:DoxX family protein n=1 Tax=Archangium gephyra TaxID=48 RepID=UPI003B7A3A1E
MKLKISYWAITGLFCLMMTFSGFMSVSGNPQALEGMRHLGYPAYFGTLLGAAKLLGVVALLVPLVPRTLREWAYAGFAIDLVAAAVSHAAVGDPASNVVSPLVILGVLLTSHQLWHRWERGATEPQAAARPAMG